MPGVMTIVQLGRSANARKVLQKLPPKMKTRMARELKKSESWNRNFRIARLFYQIPDVIAGLLGLEARLNL